ncbi:hypothetical protein [Candidatus Phytoplasma pini]|uniref:Uncharacterized protein n=1 Tax=Candidatus Phytoplasma pini TaxID=267362 RepID=A0A559KJH7_9MOLU|nr:hypothetical protein [Candidatus Phytoplasma pini]TVY12248.1 hypothetical protein MDPP_00256 [Candidatus Phytoplasma pini]
MKESLSQKIYLIISSILIIALIISSCVNNRLDLVEYFKQQANVLIIITTFTLVMGFCNKLDAKIDKLDNKIDEKINILENKIDAKIDKLTEIIMQQKN